MKYARWAMALVLVLSLTGGVAQAAPTKVKTPKEKVDDAISKGSSGVRELLKSSDRDVTAELLTRATVTATEGPAADELIPGASIARKAKKKGPVARMSVACRGGVTRRITVGAVGVTLAWREVRVAGWCWGGGRITDYWGAEYRNWSAFPYCFKSESNSDNWYVWPTVRRAYNYGVLGNNYAFGCISSQTINPTIHYRDGGSYYF